MDYRRLFHLLVMRIKMILHECSYFIEFIKRVVEKRKNAWLVEHLISFLQHV